MQDNFFAKFINKSTITNLVAITIIAVGWFLPQKHILSVGTYAFSGAITNWLAIFMLFEKVPLLYGSGVIPSRFKEFKNGIKHLVMDQFFTETNIRRFFQDSTESDITQVNIEPLLDGIDYDQIFHGLVEAITESSFGAMLSMMGGEEALEPLKEPFTVKIKAMLVNVSESQSFKNALASQLSFFHPEKVISKVESIVDQRLDELTPQMVKLIIQKMIRQHLGWLVVWGGVFGGVIGLVASYVK